uniref:4Fe-4S binding protein n=1 Tax=Gracilinema caldarium TaxID=215591 RepID=A0A7C3E6D2_9SPIR
MAAKGLHPVQIARRISLGIVLIGFTAITILHQKLQGIPSVDALDPFGGLETLMKFIAGGEFIKRINPGNIVLFGAVVALGLVLSRFFCGWFCAFGALQGVFGWIGKKVFKRRFEVPQKIDRVLRWVKYPLLVGILYFTWTTASLVIRPYDPLAAYGYLSAGFSELWTEFGVGLIILILILVGSMFYDRVFCKYVCPLGAVNAILSRVPLFRIKRVENTCISCSKCDKVCPMNVEVSTVQAINSPECIACMECITVCPTKKPSLVATLGGKAVKLWTVVIIGLAIYVAAALIGQATGMMQFEAPKLTDLATKGAINVADIKGSSTYAEVSAAFGIETERLYRELGLDMKKVPETTKLKDTAAVLGIEEFETDTVRFAVAKILGVPYAGESAETSAEVKPNTKPEVQETVPSPVATPGPAPAPAAAPAVAQQPAFTVPADFVLEGTMTIQDVAKALSVSTKQIIEKLGLPADISVDKPLKDMKDQYGYSMATLKEKIKQ